MTQQASTLAIRRDDGMAEFEQHLQHSDLSHQSLALPVSIRGGGSLGRSVGLAQLVATWATRSDSPRVRMHIGSPGPETYPDVVAQLHGFAAAYFSDRVVPRDLDGNIRMDLLRSCGPRIAAMSKGDLRQTAKGRKVEFILAHGARNQFHHLLYKRVPTRADLLDRQRHGQLVADPREMANLLRRCVHQFRITRTSQFKSLTSKLNSSNNPLGQVLHEAFRNTAEHAYLDIRGMVPTRCLRSITISNNPIEREDFEPSIVLGTLHPRSHSYFERLKNASLPVEDAGQLKSSSSRRPPHRKHIDVLEISVLDSGPGFARTISRASAAASRPSDDHNLVADCFRKHMTAKSGQASGIGLGLILEFIHELRGFMRVRTSTTEAFFAGGPDYDPTMEPRDFIQSGLAEVQGTSIVFGIPLVY